MLTYFSYHFSFDVRPFSVWIKSVLSDSSFETHLFVICMRIISLQNLATKVVVTRKGWLKSYLRSITTPAPISVDQWYSQTGASPRPLRYPRICGAQIVTSRTINVPFSHRPPPWLLGSLSIFNGYLTCPPRPTFRNSPLTYTGIWGVPIWVIDPPILYTMSRHSETNILC